MPKKESRREKILEAATRLFLSKGFRCTKIIDIANEAGIGKGTVYEYFSSKEQIFETLFSQKFLSTYDRINTILAEKKTSTEKLISYIKFESTLAKEIEVSGEAVYNLLIDFKRSSGSLSAENHIKDLIQYRFNTLYNIISQGIKNSELAPQDPMLATVAVIGAMSSYQCFNMDLLKNSSLPSEKKQSWKDEDLIHLLLHGLGASA